MIRVVVADDSPTVRELLSSVIAGEPGIQVVGVASNGREAVDLAVRLRPDLITMDVNMPVMDGLEATKEIMVLAPTPILIVTSQAGKAQVELSLSAMRAGALMLVPTPGSPRSPEFPARAAHLLAMVRAMAAVKVVRRWAPRMEPVPAPARRGSAHEIRLIAIAASTGGPAALHRILMGLPRDFPVPILVVQHIAAEFVSGLAQWLSSSCDLHVKVAEEGEPLVPRTVFLAPDDFHLGVTPAGRAQLSPLPPVGGFRPSGTFLFESAARAYGASLAAVILTGMGRDGVDGLRVVRAGGGFVIAQDEATSVVNGMPGEAVAAGLADAVLPVQEIAPRLMLELTRDTRHELSNSRRRG